MQRTNLLYSPLNKYVQQIVSEFDQIPKERRQILEQLAISVESRIQNHLPAKLIFICTHNSRRSHISQIWAQTAAYYYGIKGVESYSGGTEATAFNERAVKAMQEAGFQIRIVEKRENPLYEVKFAEGAPQLQAWSKIYDAEGNPDKDFFAIMTCSHADENCPLVRGALQRIAIPYNDPKDYDSTPQEVEKYCERVHQIAREMFYAFSLVKVKS